MSDADVAIVGAGPVGLFLAGELVRRGHSCVVIERASAASTHSKALAIMPRTLQLFERAGTAQPFLAQVNRVSGIRFITPHGAAYVRFDSVRTAYPFVSILPQWKTEEILRAQLRSAGGAVRYGHAFESFDETGDRVTVTVRAGDSRYEIKVRFVAGCDGVRSAVRDQAGISFDGRSYAQPSLLADVRVQTSVPADEARVYIDRTGMTTLFPIDAALRRVVFVSPDQPLPETATHEWLQSRLERSALNGTVIKQVDWCSAFAVHRRVARQMRRGRIFLAGDAAHAHSPVGGQGMNVGLEDAWSLAEALSPVLAGEMPESSLDRYEAQRLPVARAVVRNTDFLLRALAHPHRVMRIGREFITPYVIRIPLLRDRVVRELLTA